MAVILDEVPTGTASDNIYDRVQKARQDALLLIDQDAEYMQVGLFFYLFLKFLSKYLPFFRWKIRMEMRSTCHPMSVVV